MPPSLSLPPLEFCFGTSPIRAAKSRPDRKARVSATLATRAVANTGPTLAEPLDAAKHEIAWRLLHWLRPTGRRRHSISPRQRKHNLRDRLRVRPRSDRNGIT